jgi:hypothetical protein
MTVKSEPMPNTALEPTAQFGDRPAVCLACTELPLAFPRMKQLTTFEYDGILFINTTAVHIDAGFNFAVGP